MSPLPLGNTALFGRAVRLTVGTNSTDVADLTAQGPGLPPTMSTSLVVEHLHLSFKIEKSTATMPNTSEITVLNLSREHRALIGGGMSKFLQLEVGNTSDNLQVIFVGNTRLVESIRKGPDWETVIHVGDGIDAYQFAPAAFTSVPPGLPVPFAVVGAQYAQCIKSFDPSIDITQFNADLAAVPTSVWVVPQFAFGYSAEGNALEQLEAFLRTAGFRVSIQNHRLRLTPLGLSAYALLPKNPVYLLSAATGLLDSPAHGSNAQPGQLTDSESSPESDNSQVPPMLNAKSLLLPQLLPGDTVVLNSEDYKMASYTIEKLTHSGDMAGDAWWTEMELLPA